ncbi:MAG: hypothetical protein K2X82_31365, partial [Gemmataceae bacterium]|nr:hypothetical protein [Gemmataceae bacterium]
AFPPAVTGLARAVLSGGWGKVLALSIAGGLLAVAAAAGPGRPDTPPPGDGPASRQRTARPAPGRPPGGETDHPAGGAVDSRAYLPFSEGVPRRVTDFAEVHAASPEGVMRWAKSLSPGFVPVALGGHPSADPPQVHAVAVRLEGQSVDGEVTCGVMTVRPALEEALGRDNYRTLHVRWYRGDRRNFYDLSLWLRDPLDTLWYRPVLNEDVVGHLEGMRRQGCKPVMLSPHPDPGPHTTVVHWVGDGSRNRWRAEVDLPADRLPAWANAARADRLFVSIVEAYRNERGETRFGAVAWENPEGLDSAFEADLRTAEYEAKVAAYRRDGLRPVSVTSYGDPADPLYAAAWVRYVAH